MGGCNSGRWGWHSKKTQVEECHKWHITGLKKFLTPGFWGTSRWMRGKHQVGSIGFQVLGDERPTALRVSYIIGAKSGHPEDFDYPVNLTTTFLPWGGVRYWFICPLQGCGRRVGCLYLPPGGKYFGCRHCYDLSYESQQEGNYSRSFFAEIAGIYQAEYPGTTWKDVRAMLDEKTTPHMERLVLERCLREWQEYDPYEDFLTADELCRKSGLDLDDLFVLKDARLLLPETVDGRYRPKLAGWGKKLAYLLKEGWQIEEIQAWSKGRWKTENPRQWPPAKILNS
jgi:hypothetical protein